MEENIEQGKWVRLKDNPEIIFRFTFKNSNGIVDFRSKRSEPPFSAYSHDIEEIKDDELINKLDLQEINHHNDFVE